VLCTCWCGLHCRVSYRGQGTDTRDDTDPTHRRDHHAVGEAHVAEGPKALALLLEAHQPAAGTVRVDLAWRPRVFDHHSTLGGATGRVTRPGEAALSGVAIVRHGKSDKGFGLGGPWVVFSTSEVMQPRRGFADFS
jgi:hypothetical protein